VDRTALSAAELFSKPLNWRGSKEVSAALNARLFCGCLPIPV